MAKRDQRMNGPERDAEHASSGAPARRPPPTSLATMTARLLLIDDDARLTVDGRRLPAQRRLRGRDAPARWPPAASGCADGSYDALVLDLMLPDGDGLDLCRELRAPAAHAPAAAADADRARRADRPHRRPGTRRRRLPAQAVRAARAAGARQGAAAPRRAAAGDDEVLRFGRLEIDLGARAARLDGEACDLTGHQFDLLSVLAQSPGPRAVARPDHGCAEGPSARGLRPLASTCTSRASARVIEDDPKAPRRVLTVRGAGYVFARKQDATRRADSRRSGAGRR